MVLVFLFLLIIFGLASYFLILPSRVIKVFPFNSSKNVPLNSSLIIKFDKPLWRRAIKFSIWPEAHGQWQAKDPLLKNRLFRTLVFLPALDFEPKTQYQVKLENIKSWPWGKSKSFSFAFQTQAGLKPEITRLKIPMDFQDYPLSCEAASLKMALAYKGIYVSEEEIMKKIGYDLTPRQENIWGDPHQAFVGNIKGKMGMTGYGAYWKPVARAANFWTKALAFSNWGISDLVREIKLGNPVITWGVRPTETLTDCSWHTPEGKYIKAFKEIHVRLVIGFAGSPENPLKIILNDPFYGRLYWETPYFLDNWKIFENSGVVIK